MLFLCLMITALSLGPHGVRGQGPCDTAGKVYVSIPDLLALIYQCSYPTLKLNSDCVSTACPQLSQDGACPLNATGSLNHTALNLLTQTINACVGQKGPICGVTLDQLPLVIVNVSLAEIFEGLPVSGYCAYNPGSAFVSHLASTRITSAATGAKGLTLTFAANNVLCYSHFTCLMTLALPPLPVKQNLIMPNMFGQLTLNMTPMVTYDLTADPPSFNRMSNPFNMALTYTNFTTSDGVILPQVLVNVLTDVMQGFFRESAVADAPADFLSAFYACALQLALKTCH